MKIAVIIVRVLLAAMYLFASVSYFLNIMPKAPEMTAAQTSFMTGLMASVYLFPLIKITELVGGILLLIGRTAPLAALVIFPVTLNIFLYHAFLGPKDLPMVAVMLLFNLFLFYAYRAKYLPIVSK
ncbi:DoxX family membrane protein [Pedobacter psychrodurus]|uniref:DoxX family membrane protein n=1 Tax=Pedobacter psychrodurus TaxID=2530456 RepID=A0A4R0PUG3_9SPHI|nr:DoxX family membrane protein [Pedobacter psychrodurus]ARS39015.1 DoxX family protein [Sphingobacteriaceae bacterium GW460-11-11-14-LB5]TCD26188.1 DoxX family membrane protein [Pedobacter psychrodurus]